MSYFVPSGLKSAVPSGLSAFSEVRTQSCAAGLGYCRASLRENRFALPSTVEVLAASDWKVRAPVLRQLTNPGRLWAMVTAFALLLAGRPALAQSGTQGMVASVDKLATDAGVRTLKSGGNAVDAAVAVALMLGVVDGADAGIGGGCFM